VPGLTLYGTKDVDSPRFASKGGVIAFNLKGMMADRTARALAERGIGVRWGCHCAHMFVKHMLGIHPVLEQFQGIFVRALPWIALPGVVRASFGIQSRPEDVDALVQALQAISAARGGLRGSRKSKFKEELEGFAEAAARGAYGEPEAMAPIRAA
jgi:selenocysteine lyase/cysteine desulfurase